MEKFSELIKLELKDLKDKILFVEKRIFKFKISKKFWST